MHNKSLFSGFDFTNIWQIATGSVASYPYLRNNIPDPLPGLGYRQIISVNSLSFDGTNSYVDAGDAAADFGASDFTISFWIYKTDSRRESILTKRGVCGIADFWGIRAQGTTISLEIYQSDNNNTGKVTGDLSLDEWHHIAFTRNGPNVTVYTDGRLSGTLSTGGTTQITNNAALLMGSGPCVGVDGTSRFSGTLDEVRIWSKALTAKQIRRNMFQTLDGTEAGLTGYWPFDELSGSLVVDASVNNNDGTLHGELIRNNSAHPYGTFITGNEGWHMMSSAVIGTYSDLLEPLWIQGITQGGDTQAGSANLFTFDEATFSYKKVDDATLNILAGSGFIVWVYNDQNFDGVDDGFPKVLFTDLPQRSGTVSPPVSYTDRNGADAGNEGWNLVGNPYGATIDWDATGWTKTNLDNTIYVWSDTAGTTGAYLTWNGVTGTLPNGLIAPWQGFWVKANAENPALTFTDEVRSAGGVLYDKAPVPQIEFELQQSPLGRGQIHPDGSRDESGVGSLRSQAIVMFSAQAKVAKDRWDAWKLQSLSATYLSLYTTSSEGYALDINALPAFAEATAGKPVNINLDFDGSDLGGSYTLRWDPQAMEQYADKWEIVLIDHYSDKQIAIDDNGEYSFVIEGMIADKQTSRVFKNREVSEGLRPPTSGPIPQVLADKVKNVRFELQITPKAKDGSYGKPYEVTYSHVWPNPFSKTANVRIGLPEAKHVTVEVYNILGQRVAIVADEMMNAGYHTVQMNAKTMNVASGVYFCRMTVGNHTESVKMTLIK